MDHARFASERRVAGFVATALVAMIVLFAAGLPATVHAQPAKPGPSAGAPLDINQATAEELTALPGIGPAMADRIVAFREEHGKFRRVEDLMKVKGIGEKSFEKLRRSIKVSDGS
jgi:competence protein ComEA